MSIPLKNFQPKKSFPEIDKRDILAGSWSKSFSKKKNNFLLKNKKNLLGIDALINNIGIFNPGHLMSEKPSDEFLREVSFNVASPQAITRAAMPHLRKSKGSVVFISSINGKTHVPGAGTYCVTKARGLFFIQKSAF